mmetsp:Transcript_10891/g.31217  ORF Transcript_10891/g.31217 Transcript_10891/m.31217 type:complete len:948 (+) Transcript_10891:1060-3903(+)
MDDSSFWTPLEPVPGLGQGRVAGGVHAEERRLLEQGLSLAGVAPGHGGDDARVHLRALGGELLLGALLGQAPGRRLFGEDRALEEGRVLPLGRGDRVRLRVVQPAGDGVGEGRGEGRRVPALRGGLEFQRRASSWVSSLGECLVRLVDELQGRGVELEGLLLVPVRGLSEHRVVVRRGDGRDQLGLVPGIDGLLEGLPEPLLLFEAVQHLLGLEDPCGRDLGRLGEGDGLAQLRELPGGRGQGQGAPDPVHDSEPGHGLGDGGVAVRMEAQESGLFHGLVQPFQVLGVHRRGELILYLRPPRPELLLNPLARLLLGLLLGHVRVALAALELELGHETLGLAHVEVPLHAPPHGLIQGVHVLGLHRRLEHLQHLVVRLEPHEQHLRVLHAPVHGHAPRHAPGLGLDARHGLEGRREGAWVPGGDGRLEQVLDLCLPAQLLDQGLALPHEGRARVAGGAEVHAERTEVRRGLAHRGLEGPPVPGLLRSSPGGLHALRGGQEPCSGLQLFPGGTASSGRSSADMSRSSSSRSRDTARGSWGGASALRSCSTRPCCLPCHCWATRSLASRWSRFSTSSTASFWSSASTLSASEESMWYCTARRIATSSFPTSRAAAASWSSAETSASMERRSRRERASDMRRRTFTFAGRSAVDTSALRIASPSFVRSAPVMARSRSDRILASASRSAMTARASPTMGQASPSSCASMVWRRASRSGATSRTCSARRTSTRRPSPACTRPRRTPWSSAKRRTPPSGPLPAPTMSMRSPPGASADAHSGFASILRSSCWASGREHVRGGARRASASSAKARARSLDSRLARSSALRRLSNSSAVPISTFARMPLAMAASRAATSFAAMAASMSFITEPASACRARYPVAFSAIRATEDWEWSTCSPRARTPCMATSTLAVLPLSLLGSSRAASSLTTASRSRASAASSSSASMMSELSGSFR